ncbi:MAG: hypothetical protein COV55_01040 [Candidatus Komeilibacteria bacterium CG11_big_fil_rev_8_21_14_0_20_36_20]|uniref:Glycosyl transferase family 1 domain-containing protein n=1 Tax=Candidatus Komeilibacteria bacterium CG11_big_fil_rev_8_21_14_0_20_36_20 TaxID=1974477 RepID=A0A2H0NDQ1_9BACT|nr:MAG: hypothetical protein COV55_01040 [Candidatus Komeilibacteria bacterium CG11_big_fil_rev_8_21_14_0_20_36_20]PIR81365.1 MAG: hypothetical protein COU21_04010 [Candidatus Komeilibacteria bacterium CG10_big_fil_rev_8_21_14_0_10_36_65]PJC54995.1 MAG: hypothetical protein CO027_04680 [Candidatus Komeilibacteria bacterium CG_4_9_14_0_2_um_filter_36_13]
MARAINILTVSWDPTLAMNQPDFGDAQIRNIEYGKYVNSIHSITYAKKSLNLKNKKLSHNVFVYPTNSANQINFLWDAWKIAKNICLQNKIDLVLTQDPFLTGLVGTLVKKKFNCQLLIHFHGDFFDNKLWLREDWYNRLLLILGQKVVRQADAIRVMSQGIKDKLINFGLRENKIRVIPTPVDLQKFSLPVEKKQSRDKKIILSVGRLVIVKNIPLLIKAIEIVYKKRKDIILRIAGAGPEKDKIKKLTAGLDYIELLGAKDHDDLPKEYRNCDLFVLSSDSESFGKVLVEANACGKPVVATATTGAKEIVRDGYNGWLVPIGDAQAMADKILYLLNSPTEAERLGENGRQLMREKFSDNTEQIVKFWEDIIEQKLPR